MSGICSRREPDILPIVNRRCSQYWIIWIITSLDGIKNNMKPTVEGLATAFGVDRRTLYKWVHNIDSDSLPVNFRVTLKKVYQVLNSNFTDLSINGKINPVISIFLMKNNFGYKDQTEVVQTTSTESTKADEVMNKYDIIDADFKEKND